MDETGLNKRFGPVFWIPFMNLPKLIYWFSTGLLCLLLGFSAFMYLFKHWDVEVSFELLGYPTYLIYPLAILKILAIIAILSNKSNFLKNLAYAGIFYNFSLAFFSHAVKADGASFLALLGLILLGISYLFDKILKPKHKPAFDL